MAAEAVLSAFLQSLFDGMASPEFADFFRQRKLNEGVLEKLKIALLSVQKLREDAEDKQLTDRSVGDWLHKLKDVVYDAEDVLDEIATEALQRKLDAQFQTTAGKVRNSISTFFSHFVKEIEPKIKDILNILEYLESKKDALGLKEGVGRESSKRLPTTSLVEESGIFGRDDDKEKIISLMLSNDAIGNENPCVIPIVGMGGIGKTTLAQLVYKDKSVKKHFDLQAWVCVSKEFDVLKLTKTILEEVGGSTKVDSENLNLLQLALNEKLMGNKFLLVLDDVWNDNYVDWDVFRNPFKSGVPGSMVIVTTRNDSVASIMRSAPTHRLKTLLEDDCWLLFTKHAFHNGNSDARCPELKVIGRQIVKKCQGLPLLAKTIGGLLRSKLDVYEWERILKSELWDSPTIKTNILPALSLSYTDLPSHLKQCFAYCSIFPKDNGIPKYELVSLWMAEGFLKETRNKTMEEVGEDYLHELTSRSLLEQSSGNKSSFVMHDLVNDLAKYVSGQFTFRLGVDNSHEIVNKTRHLSYIREPFDNFKKFKALYVASRLHTFFPLNFPQVSFEMYLTKSVPLDLLSKLICLRVLSLSRYRNMTELPKSIGKIKHLRYLDLSNTSIKRLPDSICMLCNLQTLNLSGCKDLAALPRDMWKLINLRHLDIDGTSIKEMPMQLARLKCLRSLSKFIISKDSGACIGELGKLANLRGRLSLLELQNVVSHTDALKACLNDRKYLEELVLEWNALDTNISECQRSVLDNLRPHCNLKILTINNYGAESLPDWVGHHSFSNLVSLCLKNCKHCFNLPPLGQLSSLQDLSIVGFEGVIKVSYEFYGSNSSLDKPFGTLKFLKFEQMLKWEEWSSFDAENKGEAFSQLKALYIMDCPKLTGRLPVHLPSLAKLEIRECPRLVDSLPKAPTACELHLTHCDEVLLKELPARLRKLNIVGFDALESLPEGLVNSEENLQVLTISHCMKLELTAQLNFSSLARLWLDDCDSLKSFPLDLFPKLNAIKIYGCKNMESFTISEQHGCDLVTLFIDIRNCPNFVSFPKGGIRAPKLRVFSISSCTSLRSLPEKMHILLPSLKHFEIFDCPEVELFPEGDFPFNLEVIGIKNCEKLFAGRMRWGLQKLLSVKTMKIGGKSEDVKSFPEPELLPSSLTRLSFCEFPNMKSLDNKGLQHLTSLEELWIEDCPKLKYMPEEGLPASLSTIKIDGCPLMKKQWLSKKRKVPNVDNILIDKEEYIG
ncbi:putative disease resistance protein At3g14460 [Alnus glutinosa]|uniref:putative disease resistance protein At3g14460 n=1 Tax=Alnus glutinosa TaxID=3517 RepID=UPI002D79DBBE|nr:putative disease resistance protein At3g14460 [Alnus glutinosa]